MTSMQMHISKKKKDLLIGQMPISEISGLYDAHFL